MLPSPESRGLGLRMSISVEATYGFTFAAAQATGLLTPPLAGLSPAEHASLCWTHCLPITRSPREQRFIGSLRRECMDHLIVFNERQASRILSAYARYYNRA